MRAAGMRQQAAAAAQARATLAFELAAPAAPSLPLPAGPSTHLVLLRRKAARAVVEVDLDVRGHDVRPAALVQHALALVRTQLAAGQVSQDKLDGCHTNSARVRLSVSRSRCGGRAGCPDAASARTIEQVRLARAVRTNCAGSSG